MNGFGRVRDFLDGPYERSSFDWVITNPPFWLAEEFVERALSIASTGVAILARTVFLGGWGKIVASSKNGRLRSSLSSQSAYRW